MAALNFTDWKEKMKEFIINVANDIKTLMSVKADKVTNIHTGSYLEGGGDLSTDRTIDLNTSSITKLNKAHDAVSKGTGLTGQDVVETNGLKIDTAAQKLEMMLASETQLGTIKIGDNLNIDPDGTLNAEQGDYTLPIATDTVLGGVLIPSSSRVTINPATGAIDVEKVGVSLEFDSTGSNIILKDEDGATLSTINVAALNNEGTTIVFNSATEEIELRNDDGDLLSSFPASALVSGLGNGLNLNGSTLELTDPSNAVVDYVTLTIANIQNLQEVLDSKVDETIKVIGGTGLLNVGTQTLDTNAELKIDPAYTGFTNYYTQTQINDKSWQLKVNGTIGTDIKFGDLINFIGGQNVTIAYTSGGDLTFEAVDTKYTNGVGLDLVNKEFSIKQTVLDDIANGVTAHGWGNHALAGYLTSTSLNNYYQSGDVSIPVKGGDYRVFPKNVPSAVLDFDTITGAGFYKNMSNTGSTNIPKEVGYWYVENHSYSSGGNLTQYAHPYRVNDGKWMRNRYNGTWTDWVEFLHTGNLDLSDYQYTAGVGLDLNGTEFSFDTVWGDGRYLQSSDATLQTVTDNGNSTSNDVIIGDRQIIAKSILAAGNDGGILIKTSITENTNTKFDLRVKGNAGAYFNLPFNLHLTGYRYEPQDSIRDLSALSNTDFGDISIFFLNGLMHIWFAVPDTSSSAYYSTYTFEYTDTWAGGTIVTDITNEAIPTVGVSGLKTVTPQLVATQNWVTSQNYLTSSTETTYTAGVGLNLSATDVFSLKTASAAVKGGVKVGATMKITAEKIDVGDIGYDPLDVYVTERDS